MLYGMTQWWLPTTIVQIFLQKHILWWVEACNCFFPYFLKIRKDWVFGSICECMLVTKNECTLSVYLAGSSFPCPLTGNTLLVECGWSLVERPPKINKMTFLQEWYQKIAGYLDSEELGSASFGLKIPLCFLHIFMFTTHRTHTRAWPGT